MARTGHVLERLRPGVDNHGGKTGQEEESVGPRTVEDWYQHPRDKCRTR